MREGAAEARALRTPDDLLAWVRAHPERASLVVWDVGSDSAVLTVEPARERPVAGLPALLLAAELARQSVAGVDTARLVPASVLSRLRLPGVERERDGGAVSLGALARRALGADRVAADVLLDRLGREAVEAVPVRLGAPEIEPPLPLGGLFLSWAPADGPGPRRAQVESFLALGRSAQRDSAFAHGRAFVTSPAYRAAETARLERDGLGLSRARQREAARLSFPRGTAEGYARLLVRAARGELADAETSSRLVELVTRPATSALQAKGGRRLGVVGGGFPGLTGTAGLLQTARGGRVAVLLLEDLPDAVFFHLAQTDLEVGLVLQLLLESSGMSGLRPATH